MEISRAIIIPVYNGALYLPETFRELGQLVTNHQIIFVNDGSIDETGALLEKFYTENPSSVAIVTCVKNMGKGYAIREGLKKVDERCKVVAFTDVEIPYGVEALQSGFRVLEERDELSFVYGTRTAAEKTQSQYSVYRKIGTRLFRLLLPRKLRNISDTQSGLKVFKRKAADIIFPLVKTNRWVFDLEIFLIAEEHEMNYQELPVQLKPACVTRRGGVHFLKHGWKIVADIIRIRSYASRGLYKKT
jgi:glycosyltransferase involved in cell wall biosynthesis